MIYYTASLEGIITVLSGMSNLGQMDDNLTCVGNFQPLSEQEMDVIRQAQETLSEDSRIAENLEYGLKPIQNPYGHGKGPYDSIFQGTGSDTKKTSGAVVAQRLQTLKQNRGQQEKTSWDELVRTGQVVHIRIIAT